MNNNWHKKEKPLLGLTGLGGGVDGLAVVGAAAKTYIDEVFSTYVYEGTGSAHAINNGVDLSGEGGMVWAKNRDTGNDHNMVDTVRGRTKYIVPNMDAGEQTEAGNGSTVGRVDSFSNNGFNLGATVYDAGWNKNGNSYATWTWRKKEKFFDVVSVTGNSDSTQQVAHNLGTIPGCMMLKKISGSDDWAVYHRGTDTLTPQNEAIFLNTTSGVSASSVYWNNTAPTSTHFTLGSGLNEDGEEYIVYLFAGSKGSSDNAVDFDGDDYLSMPVSNSDFDFGASDSLTLEAFVNMDDLAPNGGQGYNSILNRWGGSGNYCWGIDLNNAGNIYFYFLNSSGNITTATSSGASVSLNEWYHLAVVKDGTTGRFFVNGKACGTFTWNGPSTNSSQPIHVGNLGDSNAYPIDGSISNARITMGQALYTTDFNVPHDPLTQTSQGAISSNVKLLCCNQSTVTGSTVAPSTISAGGDPTAVTNASIFDDSDAYFLGEDGDKSAIRCGSYIGNGSTTGPKIDLGWQPQWLMIKRVTGNGDDWIMTDTMRGFTASGADDFYFRANENVAEFDLSGDSLTINSTGFSINYNATSYNDSGKRYLYMAIRGTDGYVAKPAEAGTDVFALDTGNGSTTIPTFDSGFAVDMSLVRNRYDGSTANWEVGQRITGNKFVYANLINGEASSGKYHWDSNQGVHTSASGEYDSDSLAWMWKRGQGFDSVAYTGDGVAGREITHSLSTAPEMIWLKNRISAEEWVVGHKDMNGGTNPWQYYMELNTNNAQINSDTAAFNDTAPTSTSFTVGSLAKCNGNGQGMLSYLFTSVTGISKVGSYTGDGTEDGSKTVTFGFQPRVVLIKKYNSTGNWMLFDSVRGNTKYLYLDSSDAQQTAGSPARLSFTATGITLTSAAVGNTDGDSYLYYAHA